MPISETLPKLSDLIKSENVPTFLDGLLNNSNNFLQNTYYTDFVVSKSRRGESAFYYIKLFYYDELSFNLLGSDLKLIINPSIGGPSGSSEIPISLRYKLEILKYRSQFSQANFNNDPIEIFKLILNILGISLDKLLQEIISVFINAVDPIQQFIDDFNSKYSPSSPLTILSGLNLDKFKDIVLQIESNGFSIIEVVFTDFIGINISIDEILENVKIVFKKWVGEIDLKDTLEKLFTPQLYVSIDNISAGVEFPNGLFTPVDPLIEKSLLIFDIGTLEFSTDNGFNFIGIGTLNFTESKILNTGFTLGFTGAKIDLNRNSNIPEADADGRPNDFLGIYITDGTIGFPQFWNHDETGSTAELKVSNLLVGTGGISGTIGMQAVTAGDPSPLIKANFGGDGFEVTLDAFDITFQQNAIIGSNIHGTMKIPNFKDGAGNDAIVEIDVHIGTDGEFSVTATEDQGFQPIEIEGVLSILIKSVSIGRKDDRFYIATSGDITFVDQGGVIGKILPDSISVQKLLIWQDGEIEFEGTGGSLTLPEAMTLKIPPVELSITAIGIGSYEGMHDSALRKYKYFEFSGGVSMNPGGVDARGDGIKFYFTVDGGTLHVFVRIEGIGIDIIIPGSATQETASLILSGYLSMKAPEGSNPAASTEYSGGIDFTLPKLKMGGSASMRLNPKVPAFIVDIGLELSNPILLGSTGLGIYGFRALAGQRYVVSKPAADLPEDAEWWQYYKAKVDSEYKEGIQIGKFAQEDGFSFGAGVSLATTPDAGRAFSTKLFFLLSLPEVFLLQGQGQILKERVGLDSTNDPPFFAFIAITSQSVEAAFGVDYLLPDDKKPGSIAKVNGVIEMGFFFGNSSSWYINLGRDLPETRRIQVRLLDLFDAYFYLMLSSGGIRGGAGASYELNKKFGPLKAELSAYLDVAGRISYKPKQYGASIQLGGSVGLYIFNFGFNISVAAGLAAEAPKPFIVTGSLEVCIRVLKKDRCAKFEFTWVYDNSLDLDEVAIIEDATIAKAINMLTREPFGLRISSALPSPSDLNDYVVPMDSYIDIEFKKGVLPASGVIDSFGGNTMAAKYFELVSPQKSKSSQVRHEFHLLGVNIKTHDGTNWVPYDIFDAATPLTSPLITANLNELKDGYWQYESPNLHNKLRILGGSMLDFISQGSGDVIPEDLGIMSDDILCAPEPIEKTCIDFNDLGKGRVPGDIITIVPANQLFFFSPFLFRINGENGHIVYQPYGTYNNALSFHDGQTLEIFFADPMACVELIMQTFAPNVTISYFRKEKLPDPDISGMPVFEYVLIPPLTVKTQADLANPITYNNINAPVDKIIIEAGVCETGGLPFVCDAAVTQQARDLGTFLKTLGKNSHLALSTILYPDNDLIYNGVFQNTSLYSKPLTKALVIQTRIALLTTTVLDINLVDNFGFSCNLHLESTTSISWRDILDFNNLRPDPSLLAPGKNYDFLIDASLPGGTVVTIKGRSCYPIINCHDDCGTFLYDFCFLSLENAMLNATMPTEADVQAETDAMTDGLSNSIQPIWRPNTYFAIEIITQDKLYEHPNTSSTLAVHPKTTILGFRTRGPVGHFHPFRPEYANLLSKDREAEFKLAKLQHYIDYTKSYPNADGAIINAKPLFYIGPELLIFYIRNYVYEFFRDWDVYQSNEHVNLELETIIKDPAPDTAVPPLGSIAALWQVNSIPHITAQLEALNNMIANSDPCVDVVPITPMGINTQIPITELKPLKLYTAIFNAKYKLQSQTLFTTSEIHRYVFQTSRYASFDEQVNSYVLERNLDTSAILKEAVFEIEKTYLAADIILALDVINDTIAANDPLRLEFADKYDRLMDKVLKIGSLQAPITTEFNIMRDTTTGNIIGVLIRNPEPFNDPKIPDSEIAQTINLTINGSNIFHPKKVFSKDKRNIFLTNGVMSLLAGSYEFTFEFRLWDGSQYAVKASEVVTINV